VSAPVETVRGIPIHAAEIAFGWTASATRPDGKRVFVSGKRTEGAAVSAVAREVRRLVPRPVKL
jgi:hypothetical protein